MAFLLKFNNIQGVTDFSLFILFIVAILYLLNIFGPLFNNGMNVYNNSVFTNVTLPISNNENTVNRNNNHIKHV
jgi:hypothetical protein